MSAYRCKIYIQSKVENEKAGIKSGTEFKNLPDSWVCPVCEWKVKDIIFKFIKMIDSNIKLWLYNINHDFLILYETSPNFYKIYIICWQTFCTMI